MTSEAKRINHIFHLVVNGGEWHRYAILLAAEIAASKGYQTEDMTRWTHNPYQPDLIIRTEDRFRTGGAHRKNATVTYWVEIVDSSDPPREFVRAPAEILKIDIAKCKTLEEVVSLIKERIP